MWLPQKLFSLIVVIIVSAMRTVSLFPGILERRPRRQKELCYMGGPFGRNFKATLVYTISRQRKSFQGNTSDKTFIEGPSPVPGGGT